MRDTGQHLLDIIEGCGTDILCSLPCDRIKDIIADASSRSFRHLPLTREEEGVGICAGAALAGKNPAMLIQNSGLGNMVNALLSLTGFYELPLAIFMSHRGIYKEGIPAQVPMGKAAAGLLDAMGIEYSQVNNTSDLEKVEGKLRQVYSGCRAHAFLLSPALWESSCVAPVQDVPPCPCVKEPDKQDQSHENSPAPQMSRYEILEAIKGYLDGEIVICNIGIPSKELYRVCDQPSNFYMLGSMGMATPIGLGVSLFTDRKVFVIDGDGSLLMNPGALATVSAAAPGNLTILAIDNASYGSTGNQPTLTGSCVDLEAVASGFGIRRTLKAGTSKRITSAMESDKSDQSDKKGPAFLHLLARSGNADVKNIPLDRLEIKERFQNFLKSQATT
ncbi:MAG TPA: sulfopyruvate decarboxylase subunit beta [Nitrospirae bacterium]|nr:sulfopyruvate decarboxylase subunit beta [Nitrospirota bacterium]